MTPAPRQPGTTPTRTAWAGSDRKQRLPADWAKTCKRILERDGHRCYECGNPARAVDHKRPGDDHRDANLGAICDDCHAKKSAQEGVAARAAIAAKRRRPTEQHPGLLPKPTQCPGG